MFAAPEDIEPAAAKCLDGSIHYRSAAEVVVRDTPVIAGSPPQL
jgi:hypothetical protein